MPKPMVPIGYRPILWHVMKYYAHFGHNGLRPLPRLQGRGHQGLLPQLQRGAVATTSCSPRAAQRIELLEHRHRRLAHHLRRHRPARQHRRSGCCAVRAVPRGRRDVPRQLRRRPHRRAAARRRRRLPRARQASPPSWRSGPNYSFHVVDDGRQRHSSTAIQRRHARRTSGSTAATSSCAREIFDYIEPGEELVEEPFQRLIERRPAPGLPLRGLLGADGHAQGQAAPRGAARRRPTAVGVWQHREADPSAG